MDLDATCSLSDDSDCVGHASVSNPSLAMRHSSVGRIVPSPTSILSRHPLVNPPGPHFDRYVDFESDDSCDESDDGLDASPHAEHDGASYIDQEGVRPGASETTFTTYCVVPGCSSDSGYHEIVPPRSATRHRNMPDVIIAHNHPLWRKGRALVCLMDNSVEHMKILKEWVASLKVPTHIKTESELMDAGYYQMIIGGYRLSSSVTI